MAKTIKELKDLKEMSVEELEELRKKYENDISGMKFGDSLGCHLLDTRWLIQKITEEISSRS